MNALSVDANKKLYFSFSKNKTLPKGFKLKVIKEKSLSPKIENYIKQKTMCRKIGKFFGFENNVAPKIKFKKYQDDKQAKKIDFKILENHHKVFNNEKLNAYNNTYMLRVSQLMHKNETNYPVKRINLNVKNKSSYINSDRKKVNSVLITHVNSPIRSDNSDLIELSPLCTQKDKKEISIKSYDESNHSIDFDNNQKRKLLKNLIIENNFVDKIVVIRLFSIQKITQY
jgi:hypothetical protein